MVITLIGYRGSGKSTIAAPLAKRLGWRWLDADAEIEREAGLTIREIFESAGEPEFRRRERIILARLLAHDRLVIAAGGGAILNPETRRDMRRAGPVVWLSASIDSLLARIGGDRSTATRRPNLTAAGGRAEIEQMLALREPLYRECASLIVETDDRATADIVSEILRQCGIPAAGGELT